MEGLKLTGEVRDLPCEKCGALMKCQWDRDNCRWYYGCAKAPSCRHALDADQKTGAPIIVVAEAGRPVPEDWRPKPRNPVVTPAMLAARPMRALWRHLLDDSDLSEPSEVLPEAFPDNLPVQFPRWRAGRK